MKARVCRSSQALDDLREIARYVARESGSRETASRFLKRFDSRCRQYARQPLMGDLRFELGPEIRCFSVTSYVVFYRPVKSGIEILTVIHGARDIPAVLRKLFGG